MIETVRIVKDNHAGYATINKSDFDPARHTLYDPDAEPAGDGWTVKALRAHLAELGVEVPRGAKKEDLLALLPAEET